MRSTNYKRKRIARLVRIFVNDSLEEVFGSQVTVAMMRTLRFHRILHTRLKKPGGKDRRAPNNYGMKYGIRVPRNAKEATQFDKENGNLLGKNSILKNWRP